jgi:hypothetical protein
MIYILGSITSITSILCILLGFWLGKGCPIPIKNKTLNIPNIDIDEKELEKQKEEARQWENLMSYSGEIK